MADSASKHGISPTVPYRPHLPSDSKQNQNKMIVRMIHNAALVALAARATLLRWGEATLVHVNTLPKKPVEVVW